MRARRLASAAVAAVCASVLLAACGSSDSAGGSGGGGKTLTIADIDEFSGPVNIYPGPAADGAQLAIDEINAAGGIKALGGAELALKKFDTQSQPDQGVPQATKALASNPVAIIGGSQGATVLAASNVTHRKGIPWLTTALSSNQITDRGYPELFMAQDGHSSADALLQMLKQVAPQLGVENGTVAYVYSQGTFGVSSHDSWKELSGNPFKTVADIAYPPTTTDFGAVATRTAAVNADIILAGCYPGDCAALGRLWKTTVKPKAKIIAVLGASTTSLTAELKNLGNGLILGGAPDPQWKNLPASFSTMYDNYKKKYNEGPGTSSYAGYINIKFIAKALEQAKSSDPKKLTAALHQITLGQTEGNIYPQPAELKWSERGTYADPFIAYVQIQGGEGKSVFPDAIKQSDVQPYGAS